jgi:hypothetical protein
VSDQQKEKELAVVIFAGLFMGSTVIGSAVHIWWALRHGRDPDWAAPVILGCAALAAVFQLCRLVARRIVRGGKR